MTTDLGLSPVCPMTIENCKKYHVSDAMAKRFCSGGCSDVCGHQFFERFGKRGEGDE